MSVTVESNEEFIPVMKPIESSFQKRARLENESRIEWNRQVEEAKLKRTPKTVEELEKETGVA